SEQDQVSVGRLFEHDMTYRVNAVGNALAVIVIYLADIGLYENLARVGALCRGVEIGNIVAHARLSTAFVAILEGDNLTAVTLREYRAPAKRFAKARAPGFPSCGRAPCDLSRPLRRQVLRNAPRRLSPPPARCP